MDAGACRRAAVESLSENLTDGFVSPIFWYALLGLPGIVLFKVVSTMDSMVGYKTPQYLRFGWCGARLDDVMNYLPARLTWLVIALVAFVMPGFSGRKAWSVGLAQHGVLLGPNSGWSEAATAGALERRIVGPIWLRGVQVTDLWVGDPVGPSPFGARRRPPRTHSHHDRGRGGGHACGRNHLVAAMTSRASSGEVPPQTAEKMQGGFGSASLGLRCLALLRRARRLEGPENNLTHSQRNRAFKTSRTVLLTIACA